MPGTLRKSSLRIADDHARDLLREVGIDVRKPRQKDARLAVDLGEIEIVIEAAAAERVGKLARRVRGQHHARDRDRFYRPELGNRDLEIRKKLEQERLELLVGAVDLVDQKHRRRQPADRGEERPLQQIALREDVLLDLFRVLARALARLDGKKLALVVPLVERGVLVEPLVALEADQLGLVHLGERLRDLRLADARLAFDQERPAEKVHQPERGRKIAVGDVAGLGETSGDVFAASGALRASFSHGRRCPRSGRMSGCRTRHFAIAIAESYATGGTPSPGCFAATLSPWERAGALP